MSDDERMAAALERMERAAHELIAMADEIEERVTESIAPMDAAAMREATIAALDKALAIIATAFGQEAADMVALGCMQNLAGYAVRSAANRRREELADLKPQGRA